MKATLRTPNTLYLAVWRDKDHTVAKATLRDADTDVATCGEYTGTTKLAPSLRGVALLADALRCLDAVHAAHVIVYTNDEALATLYRAPVRLEPTNKDRMARYNPDEWDVLRRLCGYTSWRLIRTDNLTNARRLWEETYAAHG